MNINDVDYLKSIINNSIGYKSFIKNKELIKWCTPSIFPEIIKLFDVNSEGSIVIDRLGKLQSNTRVFEAMHKKVSKSYKNSGHSHFCCEGTTGSNRILLSLLSDIFSKDFNHNGHVLATRNVHQSIVINAEKNKIPIRYLNSNLNSETQIFLPPSIEEIKNEIDATNTKVVLITNPTYEGLSCNLEGIIKAIREINKKIVIYIDEAWGAHLAFHKSLPKSGTELNADIVVQSMHKHGGAPNPSSLIHLNKTMTKSYYQKFIDHFNENTSTTYSYPLLGAMDLAVSILHAYGNEKINTMIEIADLFREEAVKINGIKVIAPNTFDRRHVHSWDKTEILLDVTDTGLTGNYISEKLEMDFDIITSGEQVTSLTFLTTFQTTFDNVSYTIASLIKIIELHKKTKVTHQANDIKLVNLPPKLEVIHKTYENDSFEWKNENIHNCVNKVLAENIRCYPPGVYVGQKGERINSQLIKYLLFLKEKGAHVDTLDKTLKTLRIVK